MSTEISNTMVAAAASSSPLEHPKYRADIDGLRGLAVLAVVGYHAFPGKVKAGFIGVDVFFVISGYLISSIIFKSLARDAFDFKTFYARRIKRIFPALILVLVSCYIFGWFTLMAASYSQLGKQIAAGAGFLSNIALLQETGYFDRSSELKPLLHLWSLGIEEQFYLAWPLLLYCAWKLRANLALVAITLALSSFALNIYVVRFNPSAAFYLPFTRFWELAIGSILAFVTLNRIKTLDSLVRPLLPRITAAGLANVRSLTGFILVGVALVVLSKTSVFPGWWALFPTIGSCLIISAGPNAWLNRWILTNPVVVWFGLISFPLYLWHWPLLSLAKIVEFGSVSTMPRIGLVLIATLLAWVTYRFVERPIRFGGHGKQKVLGLCGCMALVAVVGLTAFGLKGLPARAINNDARMVFITRYQDLHDHGLATAYRSECDFYDWDKNNRRRSIASTCTKVAPRESVFLWGDSHAQALSSGLLDLLHGNPQLAQVATSGCKPSIDGDQANTVANACNISNEYAIKEIARLRPRVVIMAQSVGHEATDWDRIANRLHMLGAGRVVLIGPTPQWLPSLPLVFVRCCWGKNPSYIKEGLDTEVFVTDTKLDLKYGHSTNLTYVSLIKKLCNDDGCLVHVPDTQELMAVDYGHLSPLGSAFVASRIIGERIKVEAGM